uniref:DDRGK domain-containing protein 1 n=1 Tax=Macrostomum lignano TaxID=282301 RepID=A0A1I8F362_9PLAT
MGLEYVNTFLTGMFFVSLATAAFLLLRKRLRRGDDDDVATGGGVGGRRQPRPRPAADGQQVRRRQVPGRRSAADRMRQGAAAEPAPAAPAEARAAAAAAPTRTPTAMRPRLRAKVGVKKQRKLDEKEARREEREREQKERLERRQREDEERQKRQADEAAEEADAEAREAAEREEARRREEEEYARLRSEFTVEEEGAEADGDETGRSLAEFVALIEQRKSVQLEELADEFGLRADDCAQRLRDLLESGRLTGVLDDRGKFVHITRAEYEAVAAFIRQRGKVSLQELVENSNRLLCGDSPVEPGKSAAACCPPRSRCPTRGKQAAPQGGRTAAPRQSKATRGPGQAMPEQLSA